MDDSNGIVDTNLELRFNAGGELEWRASGYFGAFSNDLDTATPGTQTGTLANISYLDMFMGVGNDAIIWTLDNAALDVKIDAFFAGTSRTSILMTDSTNQNNYIRGEGAGIDLITLYGGDSDDNLAIDLSQGNSDARVSAGSNTGDRVEASYLPPVEFLGINNFAIGAYGDGTKTVTFVTPDLSNANSYSADLGERDTLILEGSNSVDDRWTASQPSATELKILDETSNKTISVDTTDPTGVIFRGLGGNDRLDAEVDSADILQVPVSFDGGAGNDILLVRGAPATAVDQVIFTPGSSNSRASLQYADATGTLFPMAFDLQNIELVSEQTVANQLTVNGTSATNSISYSGPVTIGGFATVAFQNKTVLNLDGLEGNDVFHINQSAAPIGLTQINVDGGAKADVDRIILANGGKHVVATKKALTAAGKTPISFTNIDRLRFDRNTLADVSALIKLVANSGSSYGFPTLGRTLTFKNKSSIAVEGSFVAVFKVPAGVSIDNATSKTKFVTPGRQYIRFNLGAGRLEPSTSVSQLVKFRFASVSAMNAFKSQGFSVDLYAGLGAA